MSFLQQTCPGAPSTLGLCWALGHYNTQDRCISASWNSKSTVLFREQPHDQREPTVLWEPGELRAGGQEQHHRENGHDSIMLREEGSDKPSHLATRRWDSSALGESRLSSVRGGIEAMRLQSRWEGWRQKWQMLTALLRYLKGSLSTFPDASFQMHGKFCDGKRSIFFSSPFHTHTQRERERENSMLG